MRSLPRTFLLSAVPVLLFFGCKNDPPSQSRSAAASKGDGVCLQLHFKPGESYEYRSENKMVLTEQVLGQEIKTTNDMSIALRFDVTGREAGGIKMDVTYQKLALRVRNMLLQAEYDSEDRTGQATGGIFGSIKGLIGKKFNVLIAPNGRVEAVTGLDTLLSNLEADNSDDPLSRATASHVQKALSDTAMHAMITDAFHFYPTDPVRIGDSWSNIQRSVTSVGDLVLYNTYRLNDVKNGVAAIDVIATMVSDSTKGSEPEAGSILKGVKLDLQGTLKGTIAVDVATGMMREGISQQDLTGNIAISGMSVPVTMHIDMKMTGARLR